MRMLAAFAFLAACAFASTANAQNPEPFAPEIQFFSVEDEIYPPPACATLFVGSSSIRFWTKLGEAFPGVRTIRRGFGGSTITDVNFYFDRIVAPYKPKRIVFYAGENDINAGKPPEAVATDFQEFMARKAAVLGETPVYFISIKPSLARQADFDAQTRANALISALADERDDLVFVDVASLMMKNGAAKPIFISDGLHMNHAGYEIWRRAITLALKKERASRAPHCK